ncbi:MAG: type I restriction enzyme HsdR N-terminal domain-containing protein [Muribaculaceae bacterium]|nr:type I restriction enzyme HsdR N-terminal domain-containing protein [Muribaculaceae bacterium]
MRLNLPSCDLNIKKTSQGIVVYDILRKRFVALTPEEWVRQNFVHYLINVKQFPLERMANEVSLVQNGIKRRCDSLVADREGKPLVIVEYKATTVEITQDVFDQIVRYNMVMRARYLIVSNGMAHYCCAIDYEHNSYRFLPDIPTYQDL